MTSIGEVEDEQDEEDEEEEDDDDEEEEEEGSVTEQRAPGKLKMVEPRLDTELWLFEVAAHCCDDDGSEDRRLIAAALQLVSLSEFTAGC